jgi:hypothetical protein
LALPPETTVVGEAKVLYFVVQSIGPPGANMATWDPTRDPSLNNSQNTTDNAEQELSAGDTSASQGDAIYGTLNEAAASGVEYQTADNDVLAAITLLTPDTLQSIEHALDQLTSTTDLFDVPALDFNSGTDT